MPCKNISMPCKNISLPCKNISMPFKNISMSCKDISMSCKNISMSCKNISNRRCSVRLPHTSSKRSWKRRRGRRRRSSWVGWCKLAPPWTPQPFWCWCQCCQCWSCCRGEAQSPWGGKHHWCQQQARDRRGRPWWEQAGPQCRQTQCLHSVAVSPEWVNIK